MAGLSEDTLFIGCRSQRDVFARKEKLRAERKITTGLTQRDRAQSRAHVGQYARIKFSFASSFAVAFLPSVRSLIRSDL